MDLSRSASATLDGVFDSGAPDTIAAEITNPRPVRYSAMFRSATPRTLRLRWRGIGRPVRRHRPRLRQARILMRFRELMELLKDLARLVPAGASGRHRRRK
jgi:hypothetical protein